MQRAIATTGVHRPPSWRLRVLTWCYGGAAVLGTVLALYTVALALDVVPAPEPYPEWPAALRRRPWLLLSRALLPLSAWMTWRLLAQRQRLGVIAAAIPSLLALYGDGFVFDPFQSALLPLLLLFGLVSVWRELE